MAIVLPRGAPAKGENVIGQALRDLRRSRRPEELANSALGGANLNLSQPLPVYRLGLDQIDGPGCMRRAEHVGWRYLIDASSGHEAFADVRGTGGVPPRFASLSQNQHAVRLRQATEVAQSLGDALPDDYEARIVEIPALNTAAVWLANKEDIYIPYMDMKRIRGAEVQVEKNFVGELLTSASALRRQMASTGEAEAPAPAMDRRGSHFFPHLVLTALAAGLKFVTRLVAGQRDREPM